MRHVHVLVALAVVGHGVVNQTHFDGVHAHIAHVAGAIERAVGMAVTIGYIFVTQKIIPLKHFDLYAQNNIQIDFNTIKIILEYPKHKFCNFSSKTAL